MLPAVRSHPRKAWGSRLLALTLPWLIALPALAAGARRGVRPVTKDWDEVERGFYVGGTAGGGILLGSPGDAPGALFGLAFGVASGWDVMPRLQLEAALSGVQVRAPASYRGAGESRIALGGDFTTLVLGLRARYGYLAVRDSQGIERLYLTVSGGGGLLTSAPSSQLGGMQPQVFGGLGLRYYTRMRHFSLGLDLDVVFGISTGTLLLHPQASLAYTF